MISEMNFFERIVYILQNYGISYLKGAGTTLLIALVSTAIGCVIGFAVAEKKGNAPDSRNWYRADDTCG